VQNFGKSKSDSLINIIAETTRDFDIVALVEVVSGYGGPQAVARLKEALDRKGSHWDYVISDPTQSKTGSSERYAFLWKSVVLKKTGQPFLEKTFEKELEREPFFCSFVQAQDTITMCVFHAVPKSKQPETELKYLKLIAANYVHRSLIICGDFNCSESNNVFGPLKTMDYRPALSCQKTTLKSKRVNDECLASEYDNIFYPSKRMQKKSSGVIEFHSRFPDLKSARKVSDHLPVYAELRFVNVRVN